MEHCYFGEYIEDLRRDARELKTGDRVKLMKLVSASPLGDNKMPVFGYGDVESVNGLSAVIVLDRETSQTIGWPDDVLTINLMGEHDEVPPSHHLTRLTDRNLVNVEMLAFGEDGRVRPVYVRKELFSGEVERDLELIFRFGQNDFQPDNNPSVSVGDIIVWVDNDNLRRFICSSFGFREMSEAEYEDYKKIPQRERSFYELTRTA